MLKKDEMPDYLRTRIWNVFYPYVFLKADTLRRDKIPTKLYVFIAFFWDEFLKEDLSSIWHSGINIAQAIRNVFFQFQWDQVYDFIEFFIEYCPNEALPDFTTKNGIVEMIDGVLQKEKAQYQILNGKIVPLTSEEEIKEIEKALNIHDKFSPVREHLSKALDKWADRKNPDYENSIKESISAVESLVKIITEKEKSLSALIERLPIHDAMKRGFKELYDWTSDEARHGRTKKPLSCGEPEARYMLVTCSAFINYLIVKFSENKNKAKKSEG